MTIPHIPGPGTPAARHCPVSDLARFLRAWAAAPLQIAAIAPSGAALARLITSEIDMGHAPIVEFGPGTGVFTRALLSRGIAPADLALVELDTGLAAHLRTRFPAVRIFRGDAAKVDLGHVFGTAKAGAAVSGLGLLSMPPRTVAAILENAFAGLRAGGHFYQFTYGPRCPVPGSVLNRLGLEARYIGGTWRNLPPASVYRIGRRGADAQTRTATVPKLKAGTSE